MVCLKQLEIPRHKQSEVLYLGNSELGVENKAPSFRPRDIFDRVSFVS